MTKETNYLVVGSKGSKDYKHGDYGSKYEKAKKYKKEGIPIQIISEIKWGKGKVACLFYGAA